MKLTVKPPNAAEIAKRRPNITKSEARKEVQEYKQQHTDNKSKGADGNRKHYEAWQREVQNTITNAIRLAATADQKRTPEIRSTLRAVLEQSLSTDIDDGKKGLAKLADFWRWVFAEEEGKEEEAPRSQPRRAA